MGANNNNNVHRTKTRRNCQSNYIRIKLPAGLTGAPGVHSHDGTTRQRAASLLHKEPTSRQHTAPDIHINIGNIITNCWRVEIRTVGIACCSSFLSDECLSVCVRRDDDLKVSCCDLLKRTRVQSQLLSGFVGSLERNLSCGINGTETYGINYIAGTRCATRAEIN